VKYLSTMFSVPEWVCEKLVQDYGEKTALDIVRYRNRDAGMTVRPNMMVLTDEKFEKLLSRKVWEWTKLPVPHAYQISGAVDIGRDRDFLEGQFSIQAQTSMLCAMAVGVKDGFQVLDACAAPGGKSAYMAETMHGTGRVYAWDIHPHRVDLIAGTKKRLRLENIRPMVRDASVFREDLETRLDAVLIDAPCSGFGVMLSKPDVKYRHTPEDIEALVNIQKNILDTCCRYVKKGGVLVYSTCTILKDENERQVEAFLKAHPEFSLEKLDIPFSENQGEFGLQLLAHKEQQEGFFIAKMRKNA
jgi:tRNA and rRNA cytosine-C5-methylases